MTSLPGKQTITIHLSHNISKSKVNQPIKYGQLIDYNNRNIFRFFDTSPSKKNYFICALGALRL